MNFKEVDRVMKEILELHKSFDYLNSTAKLIVKEYLSKKYDELENALSEAKTNLTREVEILEEELNKKN